MSINILATVAFHLGMMVVIVSLAEVIYGLPGKGSKRDFIRKSWWIPILIYSLASFLCVPKADNHTTYTSRDYQIDVRDIIPQKGLLQSLLGEQDLTTVTLKHRRTEKEVTTAPVYLSEPAITLKRSGGSKSEPIPVVRYIAKDTVFEVKTSSGDARIPLQEVQLDWVITPDTKEPVVIGFLPGITTNLSESHPILTVTITAEGPATDKVLEQTEKPWK